MKKLRFLFLLYSITLFGNLQAADTVFVKEAQIPVLLERQDNIIFYIRLEANTAQIFNDVVLKFTGNTPIQDIQSVKLYYSGTEALQDYGKISGITSKNGRNDAKRLNIRVATVSNDDKPKNRKTQRKADLRRRMVCKSLPVKE